MLASCPLGAQQVSQQTMQRVYSEVATPYKYGLVVVPAQGGAMIDSPTVFRVRGMWYMTYVLYDGADAHDGTGYETWLAQSENLLDWHTMGRILSFNKGGWDASQRGGYLALCDDRWGGTYRPKRYDGRYWLSYIGGASRGYEAGQLNIGVASTTESVTEVHEWQGSEQPVMTPLDADAGQWESYTLYKSMVMRLPHSLLGARFAMFYNAKGSAQGKESIGMALSNDMRHWRRYTTRPLLEHSEGITGDAQIQRMGKLYVMFYFGAFWKDHRAKAFNRFACSYDLVHWTDWTGNDLIEPSEPYDNLFAHKSFVLKHQGVVYHFYCAVNDRSQRGIAVATSRDLGHSALHFVP